MTRCLVVAGDFSMVNNEICIVYRKKQSHIYIFFYTKEEKNDNKNSRVLEKVPKIFLYRSNTVFRSLPNQAIIMPEYDDQFPFCNCIF